jgi:hypothetical protein
MQYLGSAWDVMQKGAAAAVAGRSRPNRTAGILRFTIEPVPSSSQSLSKHHASLCLLLAPMVVFGLFKLLPSIAYLRFPFNLAYAVPHGAAGRNAAVPATEGTIQRAGCNQTLHGS